MTAGRRTKPKPLYYIPLDTRQLVTAPPMSVLCTHGPAHSLELLPSSPQTLSLPAAFGLRPMVKGFFYIGYELEPFKVPLRVIIP